MMHIRRRAFIKLIAKGTALLSLGPLMLKGSAWAKGLARSRVVISRNEAVTDGPNIVRDVVREMLRRAIDAFTDGEGWSAIFPTYVPGEKIGIKISTINPALPTHPEVVEAIIEGLNGMGVPEEDIIVWENENIDHFNRSGYTPNRDGPGVKYVLTKESDYGYDYSNPLLIDGTTIYLSKVLTEHCDHLIAVPVLKYHKRPACGVTFAMKLHLGSIHKPSLLHDILRTSIPKLYGSPHIAQKTRLIVGDGLFGVYYRSQGDPPQFVYNGLIVGLDPVAIDYQAKLIIEKERESRGISPAVLDTAFLGYAAEVGLGTDDPARMEVLRPRETNRRGATWGEVKSRTRQDE